MVNSKIKINRVVTFYSYKGGVGRSMAMVNIGVVMSRWGYKVLLIDWDLEAPGLENYFHQHLNVEEVKQKKGLIDLLHLKAQCDEILVEEIPWQQYIHYINTDHFDIDLLTAGKRDADYFNKVRQFDYTGFYNDANGGQYLENLREHWLNTYDFVLIDSRTGLTDSSGICSIHMPDILVLLFTPYEQSFNGVKEVAQKAVNGQKQVIYDRFRLRALPIPSRIENAETQLLDEWMERICKESEPMLEWLPRRENNTTEYSVRPVEIIHQLKIPYKTFYAYGERLAVIERGTTDPLDLGYVYENIAALLANDLQNIHLLVDARDLLIKKARGEEIYDYSDLERKYADEQYEKEKLKDELRLKEKLIEEKNNETKKRKNRAIGIALLSAFLIAIIFYLAGRFNKQENAQITKPVYDTTIAIDNNKDLAVDFASEYTSASDATELNFNMRMAQKYFALSPAYQDSFINIKQKIEFAIAYRFKDLADSFYLLCRTRPAMLGSLLSDSIRQFGKLPLQNKNSIIKQIFNISKQNAAITNTPIDSSFDFEIVPVGFKVGYHVSGNSQLDNNQKFGSVSTRDELIFDQQFTLIAFNSILLKSTAPRAIAEKTKVELLVCTAISKNEWSKISMLSRELGSNKSLSLNVRMNFTASSNTASPYYFTGPSIKYSSNEVYKAASNIQSLLYKITGNQLPLILQKNNAMPYISVYYCADEKTMPYQQNTNNLNVPKKY